MMFSAFERRIRKSVWMGYGGMRNFDICVICGIIQIEILGYYVILPLPMRLANKIEDAVAKRRIRLLGFISDVKTYPGEAKWTSDFTPPTEPYGD